MSFLELKLPPVLLVLAFALLMWGVSQLGVLSFLQLDLGFIVRLSILLFGIIAGSLIALLGVKAFKEASTTVNPIKPESASSLVTSGIYQYTRNPMYLGMLLCVIAWSGFLAHFGALTLTPFFVLYMSRFQIEPEERALETLFGDEVLEYRTQVRRWC
ncbi:MAG: methyltransferase family protein [Marinomonas sp.]